MSIFQYAHGPRLAGLTGALIAAVALLTPAAGAAAAPLLIERPQDWGISLAAGFTISPQRDTAVVHSGQVFVYTVTLENLRNIDLPVSLTAISAHGWLVLMSSNAVMIPANGRAQVTVTVLVPDVASLPADAIAVKAAAERAVSYSYMLLLRGQGLPPPR